jgi:hypothetical protein
MKHRLFEVIISGGIWWPLEKLSSPGCGIALASGTGFKVRAGGPASKTFVGGHVETGGWQLDEGRYAGRYPTANALVRAVHDGTSLNAWLYMVIRHDGVWRDADYVRRMPDTQIDSMQISRLNWCVREIRKRSEARGISDDLILVAAANMAASMDDEAAA